VGCSASEVHDEHECLNCLTNFNVRHRACVVEVDHRIYEVQTTLLPAPGGPVAGRLCVSRDITDRVTATEQQTHQERKSVLGEIAAVMAHELNNPLAAIAMFAQMLESQLEPDSSARESASVIRRNTETCKRAIRGLLDMVAQAAPDAEWFDFHDLLEDVREFLRPVCRRAGVTVTMAPDATRSDVRGDEIQLRQVLVNLVLNAVQAMEGEGGEVTVTTEDAGESLRIRVRDTGPGISKHASQHVFEPFFTTKPPGTGTGLGLPTSRRLVEAHGGTLELEATGESGTEFRIDIPRGGDKLAWRTQARVARHVQTADGGNHG